jgi:hypothetical protein
MATRRMQAKRRTTPKPTRGGSSGFGNPRNGGRTSEEQHEDAMRVLNAEYYAGVRSLAQEVKNLVENEGMGESDALHQVVDGSYWVIYTHANFQVLMCSSNHDAYSEDFGEAPVSGSEINWAAAAYAAMARDVSERLNMGDLEEAPRGAVREVRSREAEAEDLGRTDAIKGREPLWYRVGDSYVNSETGHIGNTTLATAYLRGYSQARRGR